MDIRKLQRAIVDGLEDVKAQNIQVFNTEHLSPLFERVIIASGTSNRQTKCLAASVSEAVGAGRLRVLRTEGEGNGEWIIVDCGAAVAHVMQPSIRDYYHLEEIWGGKPVAIKLNTKSGGLVKASEGFDEDDADADETPGAQEAREDRQGHPGRRPRRRDAGPQGRAQEAGRQEGRPAALPRAKTPAERSTVHARSRPSKLTAREAAATKPAGSQKGVAKPAPKTAAGKVSAAAKTRRRIDRCVLWKAPLKAAAPVKKVVVSAHSSRNAGTAATRRSWRRRRPPRRPSPRRSLRARLTSFAPRRTRTVTSVAVLSLEPVRPTDHCLRRLEVTAWAEVRPTRSSNAFSCLEMRLELEGRQGRAARAGRRRAADAGRGQRLEAAPPQGVRRVILDDAARAGPRARWPTAWNSGAATAATWPSSSAVPTASIPN